MGTGSRLWLFVVVGLVVLSGCATGEAGVSGSASPTAVTPVLAGAATVSEGRLVPRHSARLSFATGGSVTRIEVQEGNEVERGQILGGLDDALQRAAVEGAEAALAAARAELARLEEGARPEEVNLYRVGVDVAEAGARVARAQAETAEKGVSLAEAQLAKAQAALDDLLAGPTVEELEIARRSVEMARNELWRAQAARDGVGGAVARGLASGSDLDQADAAVGVAQEALAIAQADLARVQAGARPGAIAGARAGLQMALVGKEQAESTWAVAQEQVAAAEASVRQAQAQLGVIDADPTQADLDRARAAVRQAEANLRAAQASLEQTTVEAPFSGTVVAVEVEVGEHVAAGMPAIHLADLSSWQVETDDLTEIEVVRIAVGQKVSLVADALPEVTVQGVVEAIRLVSEVKWGETTYTATIQVDEIDPRMRWGMTVSVTFEQ